jgi:SAM-dependent methyltransferase
MDQSSGYEAVSEDFLRSRSAGIGVQQVWDWARALPRGSSVVDLGCGPGFPITAVLVEEGLDVFGVDAAPSFVAAFRKNLPGTPVLCEAVLESQIFGRRFDGVLAWGLIFLLETEDQHRLIRRFAEVLVPKGRLLFTSPAAPAVWNDVMTGRQSVSLGAVEYRRLLEEAGITVAREFEDAGRNHYYDAVRCEQ